MPNWEKAPGQIRNTLEGLYIPSGLEDFGVPQEKLLEYC